MPTKYQRHGKKYYEANKALCIERNRIQQEKNKQKWYEYKASLACAKCGASHPAIFDFHHINPNDPEKVHVNKLIQKKCYTAAYKEIKEKCIVLCANCHRIHHYEEHKQKQKNFPDGGTPAEHGQKNPPESESSGGAWEEANVKQGE